MLSGMLLARPGMQTTRILLRKLRTFPLALHVLRAYLYVSGLTFAVFVRIPGTVFWLPLRTRTGGAPSAELRCSLVWRSSAGVCGPHRSCRVSVHVPVDFVSTARVRLRFPV